MLITCAVDLERGDNEASNNTVKDRFLPLEVTARAAQNTQQLPHSHVLCTLYLLSQNKKKII